jgi:nucleoside-diphosphate-sugar epimerase
MQTILGAGGAIGKLLAKELLKYSPRVRLVSRTPVRVNENDELLAGSLLDPELTDHAVRGSDIVYLMAGLEYKAKVWEEQWPQIMENTIEACKKYDAKLVFFDNVYMYDKNALSNMTEDTRIDPCSRKGKVRARLDAMIMDEVKNGNLKAMIVRSADFYGPGVETSAVMETVYKNLKKGKKAMWMGDPSKIHSCTYVPDAAKATALLASEPECFNEVWHLPTYQGKITGKEWIQLFAKEMDKEPKYSVLSQGLINFLGIFNSMLRELGEMVYQFDRDYFFNSSKFNNRFPEFQVTSPEAGVKAVVEEGNRN